MTKNKIIILILGGLILLLVAVWWLARLTPAPATPTPPEPIQSSYTQQVIEVSLNPNLKLPTPPPTLPVYAAQTIEALSFAKTLAQRMGLPQHPQSNLLWVRDNTGVNLIESTGVIGIFLEQTPAAATGIEVDRAVTAAKSFAESLSLQNLTFDSPNLLLLDDRLDYIGFTPKNNVNPAQARQAVIPFYFTVEALPLYFDSLAHGTLAVTVNSDYKITKANLTPPPSELISLGERPTLTFDQVLPLINSPQSSLIALKNNAPLDISDIRHFTIDQVSLEYRLNSATHRASPYYHLTGTGVLASSVSTQVELIIAAI